MSIAATLSPPNVHEFNNGSFFFFSFFKEKEMVFDELKHLKHCIQLKPVKCLKYIEIFIKKLKKKIKKK